MRLIYDIFIDGKDTQFQGHSVSRACTPWFTRPLSQAQHIEYWRKHYTSANDPSGDSLGHKDLNINRKYTSELRFHLTDPKTKFYNKGFSLKGGKEFSDKLEIKRVTDTLVVVKMKGMPKDKYEYELDIRSTEKLRGDSLQPDITGRIRNGDHPK